MASHHPTPGGVYVIDLDRRAPRAPARNGSTSALPALLFEPLDEPSASLLGRRSGSSFHMLVAAISISLGTLFFAGRALLDMTSVYAAPLAQPPAKSLIPKTLRSAEPSASTEEPQDPDVDACGQRLRAVRLEAELSNWAVFGSEALCLRGSSHVEASGDSQASVGSNGSILLLGSASVAGDACPGPSASIDARGAARVGGARVPLGQCLELLPIETPAAEPAGAIELAASQVLELGPGDRACRTFELGEASTLRIRGPARLVVPKVHLGRGAQVEIDAQDGPVELYVAGDFLLESGAMLGSKRDEPRDLTLFLAADNLHDAGVSLDFSSGFDARGARLCGRVYAPRARVTLDAETELRGSLVAHIVELDGFARVVH